MDALAYNPILIAEKVSQEIESDRPVRDRLARVVSTLKRSMHVDACTLYRHSAASGDIVLESSDGLSSPIGSVVLHNNEGLTGLVITSRAPVAVRDGPSHPSFRYVVGSKEELLHSYLGVPLANGGEVIGAMVVQTTQPRDFSPDDIALLNTIARQIAPGAAEIFSQQERIEVSGKDDDFSGRGAAVVRGRGLSPGCFLGSPFVLDHGLDLERIFTPASRGEDLEKRAVRKANRIVLAELEADAKAISGSEGHAILMSHTVILEDEELSNEVLGRIEKGDSAAESVRATALRWIRILEGHTAEAFAARATDFRDIANRLLRALGVESFQPEQTDEKVIALARGILPGDLMRIGADRLGAIVTTDQSIYSHASILARSFGIPMLRVDPADLDRLLHAKRFLVDGAEGFAVIDPSPEVADQYLIHSEKAFNLPEGGPANLRGDVETPDGVPLKVGLNAGLIGEFQRIEAFGPDDIGLFRTEIPFMSSDVFPDIAGQAAHYAEIVRLAGGRRVTFRTFDFGGDKVPAALRFPEEENPLMGYRSTRFMLGNKALFRDQLKALLQVSSIGPIAILLPMIATPEELNLALDEINTAKFGLEADGIEFDRGIPIGVMLEVPSVLFMIDELSEGCDFFCVGSNDLVQFLMAADRSNPRVANLYRWYQPAVLAALDHLVRQCQRNQRPVTICGEMASNPWAAMLLAGMGYDHFSVDYHSIELLKWMFLQAPGRMMRALAQRAMQATSSSEVVERFYQVLQEFEREAPPLAEVLSASLARLRVHDSM